jgi:D-glycero-D-manno-heptose 1,7-bisphosphate phosphatase
LFPGVRERLSALDWGPRGHRLGVASNQNGVAHGYLDAAMARRLLRDTVEEALGFVPADAAIMMCTCSLRRDCDCRKPKPGMLLRILRHFSLPASAALFVGDLDVDQEAARRAGVAFEWADAFFGRRP